VPGADEQGGLVNETLPDRAHFAVQFHATVNRLA